MPRLPQPGSDTGIWGEILNDFLSHVHTPGGELKDNTVGSSQLQSNAVTANAIAPNSITNAALASNAVTAAIIADGSITEALLDAALQAKINQSAQDGESAYELAVNHGFMGTENDWLAWLKGEPGEQGQTGSQGEKGDPGEGGTPIPVNTIRIDGAEERDWCIPGVAFLNNTSTTTPSTNRICFEKHWLPGTQSFDRVGFEVTVAGTADKVMRIAIATLDTYGQPSELVADFGTLPISAVGWQEKAIDLTLLPGFYVTMWIPNASPTLRFVAGYSMFSNALAGAASTVPFRQQASMGGAPVVDGGFPSSMPTSTVHIERDHWSANGSTSFVIRYRQKAS